MKAENQAQSQEDAIQSTGGGGGLGSSTMNQESNNEKVGDFVRIEPHDVIKFNLTEKQLQQRQKTPNTNNEFNASSGGANQADSQGQGANASTGGGADQGQLETKLVITNKHKSIPMIYKLKITAPRHYIVKPNQGFVMPDSSISVEITIIPQQIQKNEVLSDKFQVQVAFLQKGTIDVRNNQSINQVYLIFYLKSGQKRVLLKIL